MHYGRFYLQLIDSQKLIELSTQSTDRWEPNLLLIKLFACYSAVPVAGCAWWRALPRWLGDAKQPFYINPADLAAEQKMLAARAAYSAQPEGYKRDTVFRVEATSHEMHMLWRDFADDRTAREYGPPSKRRVKWEQLNPGSMPTTSSS